MRKLFSTEDSDISSVEPATDDTEEIVEELDTKIENLNLVTEAFENKMSNYELAGSIYSSINNKKLGTEAYFMAIEDYSSMIATITSNLGVKVKIPCMEDFKNSYSTKDCHLIATEGIRDVMKSVWKTIKEFIITFIKKIKLFFKRLLRLDLDLDEYEKYVEKMILNIKNSKKNISKATTVNSKLPSMLGNLSDTKFTTNDFNSKAAVKISNFTKGLSNITDSLKTMSSVIKDIDKNVKTSSMNVSDIAKKAKTDSNELSKSYNALFSRDHVQADIDAEIVKCSTFINDVNSKLSIEIDGLTKPFSDSIIIKSALIKIDQTSLPDNIYSELIDEVRTPEAELYRMAILTPQPCFMDVYLVANRKESTFKYMSNVEYVEGISDQIELLRDPNNISVLWEHYKNLKKFNIKNLQDAVENISDVLEKRVSILEAIDNNLDEIESFTDAMIDSLVSLYGSKSNNASKDQQVIDEYKRTRDLAVSVITLSSKAIKSAVNVTVGNINYLKEVSCTTGKIYGELRYELIRYIFKSCEQFN